MYIGHAILKCIKSKLISAKSQITNLNLSNIQCEQLPQESKGLLQKYPSIYQISLSHCRLKSINHLPFIQITILQLGSNHIQDAQLTKLEIYQNSLQILGLENNQIKSVFSLAVFQNFKSLGEINLKNNPLANMPNYHVQIFDQILPQSSNHNLTLIDRYQRNGNCISDDEKDFEDDAQFMGQSDSQSSNRGSYQMEQRYSMDSEIQQNESLGNEIHHITNFQQQNGGSVVDYLNQFETFNDPRENCQEDDFENEEQFDEQIKQGKFKFKKTKKIKLERYYRK